MPDSTINRTAAGWPYLDAANYIHVLDDYTRELANKLENSDADVAAAINAANVATTKAAEIQADADKLGRLPYAMASGSFSAGQKSDVVSYTHTITFPAGRFSAAPVVVVTIDNAAGGTQALQAVVRSRTTTQAEIVFFLASGSSMGNHWCTASWVAVQA